MNHKNDKWEEIFEFAAEDVITHLKFPKDCPMYEKVIAFALDELEPFEQEEVKTHIISCTACMDLFFDLRTAEAISSETQEQTVHSEIMAFIKGEKKTAESGRLCHKISLSQKIFEFIKHFLSLLITPKGISALAACSLVMFIVIYNVIDKSIPLNSSMILTVRPPVTRGSETPGLRNVNQGDILKTGDNYKITIYADKDGYCYVILAGDSGRIKLLFKGRISAGKTLEIPGRENWEQLDPYTGDKGIETVYLISSHEEIEDFDIRFNKLKAVGADQIYIIFPKAFIKGFWFRHE
ncbi:DUF4384 [Desulfonema limicola]|uniref:DUF4384 n=1 Tax=Desulfonema limicola TaxID=45656 RepID=A0A975BAB8_9BACT|nr:DUF4384 domain-containing protein [Desulfonema limicola]QTA81708.1 DUF4384 [Desulfonema limicola]